MTDTNLPSESNGRDLSAPEVRLELTQAGVRQVLSLYAEDQAGRAAHGGMEIGFAEILKAVLERKGLVAGCLLAGVVVGLLVLLVATPLYTVTTQVVLDQQDTLESTLNNGRGGSAFIATQAEIMQSHSVVADAVARVPPPAVQEEDPVAAAMESLQASPVSGTQVVALSYVGPDPVYGEKLLRATVEAHQRRLIDDERRSQAGRLEVKEGEYAALVAEVELLEDRLREVRREYFNGGSAEDVLAAQNQNIRNQYQQLLEVRAQRYGLENQLLAGSTAIQSNDSAIRSLQDRLFQAEAEVARLRQTLQPSHPSRVAAERQVTLLREQLAGTTRATPQALQRQLEALKGVEVALVEGLDLANEELAESERRGRAEQLIMDELAQTRGIMEQRRRALLDQRLFTRLAETGEVGVTARIIAEPIQPLGPTWPNPPLVLAVCGSIGLMAGVFWALMAFRARQSDWFGGSRSMAAAGKGA
ncbi:MAG: GumC family protein [Pseudomonadales bacterium]